MAPLPTLRFKKWHARTLRVFELVDEQRDAERALVESMRVRGVGIQIAHGVIAENFRASQPNLITRSSVQCEECVRASGRTATEIDDTIGTAIGHHPSRVL